MKFEKILDMLQLLSNPSGYDCKRHVVVVPFCQFYNLKPSSYLADAGVDITNSYGKRHFFYSVFIIIEWFIDVWCTYR